MLLPYDRGDLVSRVHDDGEVLEQEHRADGTWVRALVTPGAGRRARAVRRERCADRVIPVTNRAKILLRPGSPGPRA